MSVSYLSTFGRGVAIRTLLDMLTSFDEVFATKLTGGVAYRASRPDDHLAAVTLAHGRLVRTIAFRTASD